LSAMFSASARLRASCSRSAWESMEGGRCYCMRGLSGGPSTLTISPYGDMVRIRIE
jgi:hypothetical protein